MEIETISLVMSIFKKRYRYRKKTTDYYYLWRNVAQDMESQVVKRKYKYFTEK